MDVHFACHQYKTQPCPFVRHNHKSVRNASACNRTLPLAWHKLTSTPQETEIGWVGRYVVTFIRDLWYQRLDWEAVDNWRQQSREPEQRPGPITSQYSLTVNVEVRSSSVAGLGRPRSSDFNRCDNRGSDCRRWREAPRTRVTVCWHKHWISYVMHCKDTALMCALLLRKRNVKKRKTFWLHPITSQRLLKGKFYSLYEDLKTHPQKIGYIQ